MDRKGIEEVLKTAVRFGADFAEFFWEHKETSTIVCENNGIERINSGIDEGAGIRVISGASSSYAYTNEVSLKRLLEVAEMAGRALKSKDAGIMEQLDFRTPTAVFEPFIEIPPEEVEIETKVEAIKIANQAARGVDKRINQVTVGYGDIKQDVTIANTEGIFVEDRRVRTRMSVNAVAAENGVIQTGFRSVGGTTGFELLKKDYEPDKIGEDAAKRAVLMLGAKAAPTGKMPVVMAAQAGGTMVHEACGHALEADLVQKQLSVYSGKKGDKVAADVVSVIDDGTIPKKFGSLRYDDEGYPVQKTVLINNGVLEEYMYDYQTASRENKVSTGNGRRESYQYRPIPRMRNTYIAPGKMPPEKIIKEMGEGLLVTAMGGGQVNTITGDYVFDVAEAYIIKDGEIGPPVRGATLAGNGPETLKMVEMVGKDLGYTIGICGKEGQGVPVSDAQPTMAVKELIIGGRFAESRKNAEIRRL